MSACKPATVHGPQISRREWIGAGGLALAALGLPGTAETKSINAKGLRARLSLNENPFGPSPHALGAIRHALSDACRYTGDEAEALTRSIAAHEGVSPDQIVLGEILDVLGLHLALMGGPGGEFVYTEPGYTALVDAVAPAGGVVVGVPLDARLENDLAAIAAKVNARTRAIYLVNPHNPTGTVSEATGFKHFLREVSKRAVVIVDEAYLEFETDFAERSAIELCRAGENVVVFRTFAKIYGLAGLAFGYAVAPRALAASLKQKGIGSPHTLNRIAVAAAVGSLADRGFVATARAKVIAEREKWNAFFARHNIRHADSRGNFVFFDTGRPHDEIASALRSQGIEIARAFPPFDHWVRISIGLPEENALTRSAIAKLLR
jgi:histidinol-phosphate aminotransferase